MTGLVVLQVVAVVGATVFNIAKGAYVLVAPGKLRLAANGLALMLAVGTLTGHY